MDEMENQREMTCVIPLQTEVTVSDLYRNPT